MVSSLEKRQNQQTILWESFIGGNEKAFETLFNLFSDPLYRYGMKFIPNDDLVKDCIQDIFVKIYKNRTRLSTTDNPQLYLFRALKNKLIDEIRSDKFLTYVSPEDLHFSVEYYYDPEDDNEPDSEVKDKFEKVMSLLTERQKEALYLRYQMEMSYQDISQLLNINYQSVRNLVHRAVEKVRAEMEWTLFVLLLLRYTH